MPQAKQRTVLAALLLRPGQVVAADELIAALWSEPPASARVTVQNYVRRLRRTLDDTDRSRIRTQPRGYLIQVDPDELDTARFEGLLGSARSAARAGRWDASAASARAALALWRGPPLADVESEVLVREVPRLTEMRLQALEARIEADLHLGFHQEVAAELRGLSVAHPLREQLHAQLMLALYRSGRRPEALDAFRRARQVLVGQLAIEPGAGLRALYRQMLAGDPALTAPAAAPPAATSSAVASLLSCHRLLRGGRAPPAARCHHPPDRPGQRAGRADQAARPGARRGDQRHRRGRQDRPGPALGPPGRRSLPRRAALRGSARLRPRPAAGRRRRARRVPAGPRADRPGHPGRHRRAR